MTKMTPASGAAPDQDADALAREVHHLPEPRTDHRTDLHGGPHPPGRSSGPDGDGGGDRADGQHALADFAVFQNHRFHDAVDSVFRDGFRKISAGEADDQSAQHGHEGHQEGHHPGGQPQQKALPGKHPCEKIDYPPEHGGCGPGENTDHRGEDEQVIFFAEKFFEFCGCSFAGLAHAHG